jgi:hypothetical protein
MVELHTEDHPKDCRDEGGCRTRTQIYGFEASRDENIYESGYGIKLMGIDRAEDAYSEAGRKNRAGLILTSSTTTNYCSGIGGRGTLLWSACGGSCAGAGAGM